MEYDNTNRGTLYRNENKKEENHPDYSGSLNVGGKEFWLSGWVKESKKDGKKFFSLLWIVASSTMAYAACTYHTYCDAGRCVTCTTCCYGANCNTSCY